MMQMERTDDRDQEEDEPARRYHRAFA